MNGYLDSLAVRSIDRAPAIQPRVPSRASLGLWPREGRLATSAPGRRDQGGNMVFPANALERPTDELLSDHRSDYQVMEPAATQRSLPRRRSLAQSSDAPALTGPTVRPFRAAACIRADEVRPHATWPRPHDVPPHEMTASHHPRATPAVGTDSAARMRRPSLQAVLIERQDATASSQPPPLGLRPPDPLPQRVRHEETQASGKQLDTAHVSSTQSDDRPLAAGPDGEPGAWIARQQDAAFEWSIRPPAAPAWDQAAALGSSPSVRVTIGRIEVKAVLPAESPARRAEPPPRPPLSLDDYLTRRQRSS
jgi:hypothetical protein